MTLVRAHAKEGCWSWAIYSPCEGYRYELTRIWDGAARRALFLMLNPSTATERANDPSVERCERRARRLGFGALRVCNLFAWRATNPKALRDLEDPVGGGNDDAIRDGSRWADMIICAWGVHGAYRDRGPLIEARLRADGMTLHHLGLSKDGLPRHPLYIPYHWQPESWGKDQTA